MKAWQLSGFGLDHLVLNDVPQPQPGPGEVVVCIASVSLNYRDNFLSPRLRTRLARWSLLGLAPDAFKPGIG
jgi:hypothetical protein